MQASYAYITHVKIRAQNAMVNISLRIHPTLNVQI